MKTPQNISLITALAIPVVMVVAVALAIFIPQGSVKPAYDFIYTLQPQGYYQPTIFYTVHNGKLVKEVVAPPVDANYPKTPSVTTEPELYLYDAKKNTSELITFEEAQKLQLDSRQQSPDGYEVASGSGGGVFPFFYDGGRYNEQYIKNTFGSKKINVVDNATFQFLAWVIPS